MCVKEAYISNKPLFVGEHAFQKLFVFMAFPWVVTGTGAGGLMVCECIL